MEKREKPSHLIIDPNEYILDQIKIRTSYVFWGTTPDDSGKPTIEATKTRYSEKELEEQIEKRKRSLLFDFKDVTVKELLLSEVSSTTAYKRWYNNNNIAKLTEDEVSVLLEKHPKEIIISVREVLDNRRMPMSDEERARKALEKLLEKGFSAQKIAELLGL